MSTTADGVQLAYPGEYLNNAAWVNVQPSANGFEYDDVYTDKVGGVPVWHSQLPVPVAPTCTRCQTPLFLLAQLYLPASSTSVTSSMGERFMYVFGCNKIECCLSGEEDCWKVIRLRLDGENEEQTATPSTTSTSTTIEPSTGTSTSPKPSSPNEEEDEELNPTTNINPPRRAELAGESGSSKPLTKEAKSKAQTTPASHSATSSTALHLSAKPKSTPKKEEDSDDEWGAKKTEWDSESDSEKDDATSSASVRQLLAKQSAVKQEQEAAKAAAAEKAAKKAAKKEEMRKQAEEELLAAAMEAREKADATAAASSSSSTATPAPTPAPLSTTAFRPFYLAWTAEPTTSQLDFSHELRLQREYEARQAEEGGGDEESVDVSSASGVDDEESYMERREEDVQEFFDRIERMNSQCLRYYGLNAQTAKEGMIFSSKKEQQFYQSSSQRCPHCHQPRILEAQLMPRLLYELHVDGYSSHDPGMDWTTVDIYTCSQSCQSNVYVSEACHIQPPL